MKRANLPRLELDRVLNKLIGKGELVFVYNDELYRWPVESVKQVEALLESEVPVNARGVRVSYMSDVEGCEVVLYRADWNNRGRKHETRRLQTSGRGGSR